MISYRIGFSECEHRRASDSQHVWKRSFNESFPTCQELFAPKAFFGESCL